ncbi:MAG TPA: APC family permease, partial [Dehalococcoidia bacterium]|nr:APC family permease [Dehalococcoidia bacterium]
YLRVIPRRSHFVRAAPGHLEATRLASRPLRGFDRYLAAVKSLVIGSPFASSQAIHERLTKLKALAVFSSDAISSSAYATEEILLILVLAGSGALHNALPIGGVIGLLLVLVAMSYQQTIRAYPNGGGAYIVAHENLGRWPALVAASALLVDYVLTVTVSVAAGVAAVTSAVPGLHEERVLIGIVTIGLITLGNLRGVRESGAIFAAPTYFFIFAMGSVVFVGLIKVIVGDAPGSLLHQAPPQEAVIGSHSLSLFLLLKAFSSGCAALTGIEAISNGVPAFQPPESRNARITLVWMAGILLFLFLGITFLASRFGFVPAHNETLVSALGKQVLGKNALYYGFQVATALVLFLAANTSYADFPRLSAILATDRFMPRQFGFKGDRLAFSNGILLLAGSASVLLIVFGGDVSNLIPLYAVGVFTSFTLSQTGMVVHWLKLKGPGWRLSLAVNAVGAAGTAVVALIIGATKFASGAWISILMMGVIMLIFALIRRHYDWFQKQVKLDENELPGGIPTAVAVQPGGPASHVVVPVDGTNRITMAAIAFARELSPLVTAVHVADDTERAHEFRRAWESAVPDVPLLVIESPYRAFVAPFAAFLRQVQETKPAQKITLVLPAFAARHWWERLLHNRDVHRLKGALGDQPGVNIVPFTYDLASRTAVPATS